MATRVLAPSWGSWATYGSMGAGRETALGQMTARDLLDVYRVLEIGASTRLRALVGARVASSPSPAMHNAAYAEQGLDARYLAVEADALDEIVPTVGEGGSLRLEALAVTRPLKEAAAARCEPADAVASASGAVNTILVRGERWVGHNTDGPAARALLERHVTLRGARIACVGAGGTARAVAAALREAGAAVTLFNRGLARARTAAVAIGVSAAPLDALPASDWEVLVQATPLGERGEVVLAPEALRGRAVLDAVYGAEPSPLVREARRRGLAVVDGFELLVAQAVLQYRLMTGRSVGSNTLAEGGGRWLEQRSRDA
jgi:3-dehydroquinate dehydratase/shikimate dehydrogenase